MNYDNETKKLIEDLDKQAKQIQAKIDELKNGESKYVRWRAKEEKGFYYLRSDGNIEIMRQVFPNEKDIRSQIQDNLYQIGNYFRTREEAEKYKQHLIITQKLKDIALILNDGRKIDWNSKYQMKYYIFLDYETYKLRINKGRFGLTIKVPNVINGLSNKFLETAVKEIGEKELIEYIKES